MTREQPIEPTGGPRVDHRLLATFVAVVETGSFTAAAARLHLTQQAVSAHVARLEAAIGEPLLRRTTRSHHLTPTGEVVLEDARAALSALDGVLTRARLVASAAAERYTLGFTPSLSQAMIPAILSAGSGGPVVELRQRWFDEMVAEVSEGSLDVGIVVAPAPADSIEAMVVGVEVEHVRSLTRVALIVARPSDTTQTTIHCNAQRVVVDRHFRQLRGGSASKRGDGRHQSTHRRG